MKAQLSIAVAALAGQALGAVVSSPIKSSSSKSAAGPVTIANPASAISSVLAAMAKQSPSSTTTVKSARTTKIVTGSPFSVVTVTGKTISSTKQTSTVNSKTSAIKIKSTSGKAKTTAVPAKSSSKKTTTTTKKVTLHARAASTVSASGNCGIGSPVTATYDCVNGWACASQYANRYICVSATPSSVSTASTSTLTTSSAALTSTSSTLSTTSSAALTNTPSTLSTTTKASTTSLGVNDACGAQPSYGYNFIPTATAPAGFLSESTFNTAALAAVAPSGYSWSYAGFYASLNQAGYMGVTQLSTYNVTQCAQWCDSTSGCASFDIYFERDPVINPAAGCPNPSMYTTIRCAIYNQPVNHTYATNIGEWRNSFAVVIAGANGYNKLATTSAASSASAAATSTSTKSTAVTSTATATASASPFTVLSAYFADQDITTLARANFLTGGQLVVNTSYPSTSLGSDPWSSNAGKTISILYKYNSEVRVFSALENSGVYTQQAKAFSSASAPGSALVSSNTPPSGSTITINAVVFGTSYYNSTSLLYQLYSDAASKTSFSVSDDFFGMDPNWGVVKSAVVWYTGSDGVLRSVTGREGDSVSFS